LIDAAGPLISTPTFPASYSLCPIPEFLVLFEERGNLNGEADVCMAIVHDTDRGVVLDVFGQAYGGVELGRQADIGEQGALLAPPVNA
jgi:hypothetical protein